MINHPANGTSHPDRAAERATDIAWKAPEWKSFDPDSSKPTINDMVVSRDLDRYAREFTKQTTEHFRELGQVTMAADMIDPRHQIPAHLPEHSGN